MKHWHLVCSEACAPPLARTRPWVSSFFRYPLLYAWITPRIHYQRHPPKSPSAHHIWGVVVSKASPAKVRRPKGWQRNILSTKRPADKTSYRQNICRPNVYRPNVCRRNVLVPCTEATKGFLITVSIFWFLVFPLFPKRGRWFPPGTPVSSTRKLISSSSFHCLDMTLAVAEALNPNKPKP